MYIFPAIDLFDGSAVRLLKGDYNKMTVYSRNPEEVAKQFELSGAEFLHMVDLQGAKDGCPVNTETIKKIVSSTSLKVQLGGGIRDMETVKKYLQLGVYRVVLGTAAISNPCFLEMALATFGDSIAVGVDVRDGFVAVNGWVEKTQIECFDFCNRLSDMGVKTVICTDISKDGAMNGTNIELYKAIAKVCSFDLIASGGVTSLEDVRTLRDMKVYGAILGKALYTSAIDLKSAVALAKGERLC